MEKKIFVSDFTQDPGPRYIRQDIVGAMTSGEAFYINVLNKEFKECYEENKNLILCLDGVSGYPSSFLDEAIGELVYDFRLENVERLLDFETRIHKNRVSQVKEETYKQWEKRRTLNDPITHSPNINIEIYYLSLSGRIEKKKLT